MCKGFIYEWTNGINGKKYIGSHRGIITDGYVGSGSAFKKSVKKYGIENFTRRILEYVDDLDKIKERENYYLKFYNVKTNRSFYNLKESATGGHCTDYTNTRKGWQDWAKENLKKEVYQFTLNGNLIKKHQSLTEAAAKVGVKSPSNIKYTCEGKFKTAHGYLWSYNNVPPNIGDPTKTNGKKKVKTPDGIFESVTEAQRFYNFSSTKLVRDRCISKLEKWKEWNYVFNEK